MKTTILCGLVACAIVGATITDALAAPPRVRVIHDYFTTAVPQPATVDIRVGPATDAAANPVFATVSYGDITKYLRVKPGTYTVGVFAAGSTATKLLELSLPLAKNDRITIWARQVSSADSAFTVDALQDADRKPKKKNASVRVMHGIPAAAANDVRIGAAGVGCLTPAVSFPTQAVIEVPKGTYTVGVYPPSDPNCAGAPLPGLSAEVKLKAKQRYTAIAQFAVGNPSAFQLQAVRDF